MKKRCFRMIFVSNCLGAGAFSLKNARFAAMQARIVLDLPMEGERRPSPGMPHFASLVIVFVTY